MKTYSFGVDTTPFNKQDFILDPEKLRISSLPHIKMTKIDNGDKTYTLKFSIPGLYQKPNGEIEQRLRHEDIRESIFCSP